MSSFYCTHLVREHKNGCACRLLSQSEVYENTALYTWAVVRVRHERYCSSVFITTLSLSLLMCLCFVIYGVKTV